MKFLSQFGHGLLELSLFLPVFSLLLFLTIDTAFILQQRSKLLDNFRTTLQEKNFSYQEKQDKTELANILLSHFADRLIGEVIGEETTTSAQQQVIVRLIEAQFDPHAGFLKSYRLLRVTAEFPLEQKLGDAFRQLDNKTAWSNYLASFTTAKDNFSSLVEPKLIMRDPNLENDSLTSANLFQAPMFSEQRLLLLLEFKGYVEGVSGITQFFPNLQWIQEFALIPLRTTL